MQETVQNAPEVIRALHPKGVPLPRELISNNDRYSIGKFSKAEVEVTAWRLVQFFQKTNSWGGFRPRELIRFYTTQGWNPDTMFFGLKGYWYDDGGLGDYVQLPIYIVEHPDGTHYVTKKFIERCMTR